MKFDYKILPSLGNGDCFFDSVCQALGSLDIHAEVQDVRRMVANEILNYENEKVQRYLEFWKSIVINEPLWQNIIPFCAIVLKNKSVNNVQVRRCISKFIMSKQYWADELALDIIESKTCLGFLVLTNIRNRTNLARFINENKNIYMVLWLEDEHYEPVRINGDMIFNRYELKKIIKDLNLR